MAKEKLKLLITSFTPDGGYLAILSPDGTVKIWNVSNGNLLAEWKLSDIGPASYSCMACSFVGKKRKKENSTFLIALGTSDGDILAIDAFSGDTKWKSCGCHPGGVVGLAFVNKGRSLHSVGTNGMASKMNSESGELIMEFKTSKKPISSLAFSRDEKILAVASLNTWVLSLENGEELVKFPDDLGSVRHISISNNAKNIVTSGFGEKQLHVWRSNLSSKSVSSGPVLSMRHPPLVLECKNRSEEIEDGLVVLAVSESGVAYVWNLNAVSQDEVNPTKITIKSNKTEKDQRMSENSKKSRSSILAARLHDLEEENLAAVIAYGSLDSPRFSIVNISDSGKNIVLNADETETVRENGILPSRGINDLESEATLASSQNRKTKKKRSTSDMDLSATGNVDTDNGEAMDGVLVQDDMNEPTMGEKLASLNFQDDDKTKIHEKQESAPLTKPPSADSVNVLLKQALRADDRALLLDCLYTQDEKVIANSISHLNPSDVLKLLQSLLTIIDSRGAILACALPWLRSLLLQHASGIMSQEASLLALSSLYQIIESRISTFHSALQLSSCLDLLYAEVVDDTSEENDAVVPVIFEDYDESDEEESDEAMETDQGSEEEEETFGGLSNVEGGDDMSE